MNPQPLSATDAQALRRRVAHHLFQRLAFTSFMIWTVGCLLLFILNAAGNPRPVFPAMIAMTAPVVPAALIWLLYRPLVAWRVAQLMKSQHP